MFTYAFSVFGSRTCSLNLLVFLLVAVTVSGNKFIERFQPLEITCNATGKHEAPHDVNWFRDGVPLESSVTRGIEISKEIEPQTLISRLTIKRSEVTDSGHYVCRSSSNEAAVINIQILDGKCARVAAHDVIVNQNDC